MYLWHTVGRYKKELIHEQKKIKMNRISFDYESVVRQAVYKQEELHIQDGFADGENGQEFGCRRRKRPKS